jgi:hypothetical protein
MNLDRTFCTNADCTKGCEYRITPEILEASRVMNRPLSFCTNRCEGSKAEGEVAV